MSTNFVIQKNKAIHGFWKVNKNSWSEREFAVRKGEYKSALTRQIRIDAGLMWQVPCFAIAYVSCLGDLFPVANCTGQRCRQKSTALFHFMFLLAFRNIPDLY